MSLTKWLANFSECAEFARNRARARDVVGMVRDLEGLDNIGKLTEALCTQ